MSANGLRSFTFHRNAEPDLTGALRPLVGVDTSPPSGKPQIAGLDAETAARRYLRQAFESEALPSFTQPELQGTPSEFNTLGTEALPLTDTQVVKFRQTFRHIPVYGSLVTVEMEQDNDLLSINSSLGDPPGDLDLVATLSPRQALDVVSRHAGRGADEPIAAVPRVYLYFEEPRQTWHLAYIVENVLKRPPGGAPSRAPALMDYVVDAHSGQLIAELPRTQSVEGTQVELEQPPLTSDLEPLRRRLSPQEAQDELGKPRKFLTQRRGSTLQLADEELNVHTFDFDFQDLEQDRRQLPGEYVKSPPSPWAPAAVSAHANAMEVALFLRSVLRRDNLDNRGGRIVSSINCTYDSRGGREWHNAAWIGTQMVYGQQATGGRLRSYAAGLDVVAHEILHGLTDHTARLVYAGMSGALNESYSDIFGIIVSNLREQDVGKWNWEMGEELSETGVPIRDMREPSRFRQPEHMRDYRRLRISAEEDWGGVHTNSGIHNKAAYNLLTAKDSQGNYLFKPSEVAILFYLALTQQLSRTSTFSDSRRGVEMAARTFFRKDERLPDKLDAIANAFDSVGITAEAGRAEPLL